MVSLYNVDGGKVTKVAKVRRWQNDEGGKMIKVAKTACSDMQIKLSPL